MLTPWGLPQPTGSPTRAPTLRHSNRKLKSCGGQNEQLRGAAALVAKESVELLERWWIPVENRLPEPLEVENAETK